MKKGSSKSSAAGKKKPAAQTSPKTTMSTMAEVSSTAVQPSDKGKTVVTADPNITDITAGIQSVRSLMGGFDKRLDVLETINRFSEEYLAGLIEDDLLLDERVRQEMPSRLEALQKQLEKLELESFTKQRSDLIARGNGTTYEANDALVASVNAKASQTEISLSTLKSRLSEMHQKLVAKQQLAQDKKISIPSKVKPGEFHAEGDAFDDELDGEEDLEGSDDYFGGSAFDTDDYLDEVDAGVLHGGIIDMKQIISAAQKDLDQGSSESNKSIILDFKLIILDLVTKAESELQGVLAIFSSPNLTLEEKLQSVQPRLREVIQQDLYWRSQADKLNRRVHDLRLQKRLSEMERDRLRSINGRLEGFCKDLQSENRKIKIEAVKVEEAMKTAFELTSTSVVEAPAPSKKDAKKKKSGKESTSPTLGTTGSTSAPQAVPNASFPAPLLPSREALEKEDKQALINRLMCYADFYETRENHYTVIKEARELEARRCETKIAQQQLLLERTISKLDMGESRVNELARSEAELKTQVRQYVEKFRQVEETLVKSNELFGTFRGEMEQMSLKLARFERENHQMQTKCQTLSRNIIEMADERTKLQASIETLKAQKGKLEQLCRTLQAERNAVKKVDDTTVPAASEAEAVDGATNPTSRPAEDSEPPSH